MKRLSFRPLRKGEIHKADEIIRLNYGRKFAELAVPELKAKFSRALYKPEYLAAFQGNDLVGFAGYNVSWMDWRFYTIFWVNVNPKFQGEGVGTQLVNAILNRIRKKRGRKQAFVLLTTTKPHFYEHLGFKVILKPSKAIGRKREPDVLMVKKL